MYVKNILKSLEILACVCLFASEVRANLDISNKSDDPIYAAIYYTRGTKIERATEVTKINPGEEKTINFPKYKWFWTRRVFVSEDITKLSEKIDWQFFDTDFFMKKFEVGQYKLNKAFYKGGVLWKLL